MTIRRYPAALLLFSIFFVVGCSTPQRKSGAEAPQVSPWGEWCNGLRCRVTVPKEIEQGMRLEVKIELKCEPNNLQAGVKQLNTFLRDGYLKLMLKNTDTRQEIEIKPYHPSAGMPVPRRGISAVLLDGTELKRWKTSFPLARAHNELVPGMYTCEVEFSYSWERRMQWGGTKAEWEAAGFWTGIIASGPFSLKILKEAPKTKEFLLPRRLRLEKGLEVRYRKEDAEEVELPVRNGFFIGTKCYTNDSLGSLGTGTPVPDDVNYIDYWHWYEGGDVHLTYTIEIFETSDAPVHMWGPGPGSGGYKVLWKRSFEMDFTEKEIKALR